MRTKAACWQLAEIVVGGWAVAGGKAGQRSLV